LFRLDTIPRLNHKLESRGNINLNMNINLKFRYNDLIKFLITISVDNISQLVNIDITHVR